MFNEKFINIYYYIDTKLCIYTKGEAVNKGQNVVIIVSKLHNYC
jgi:hypothetical protein